MSLPRPLTQDEIAALEEFEAVKAIKKLIWAFIQNEYNDLILALGELRRRRANEYALINEMIDSTVANALEVANELIVKKSLSVSAKNGLPLVTSLVHQITNTIDNPSETQRQELNSAINNMQSNLKNAYWKSSPVVNTLVTTALLLLAVSFCLATLVASPVLLAVGVSGLIGSLIFGMAIPNLMIGTGIGIGAVFYNQTTNQKIDANHKITMFGSSANRFVQTAQETERFETKNTKSDTPLLGA
jgi:hypothetical protein